MRSPARWLALGTLGLLLCGSGDVSAAGPPAARAPAARPAARPALKAPARANQGGQGGKTGKGSKPAKAVVRQARVPITVPALLARSRPAASPGGRQVLAPPIEMEHITSHAHHLLRPDVRGGGFSPRQMRTLMDFLRCHHTNKRRPMDPRLVSLLYQTARHYNNAKLYVIAGYRAPSVAAAKGNPKSPHKRGVACDFRLAGVPIEALRDYLRRTYNNIGVGYYPNSGFIHLDVGRTQSAFWIDYSSPGAPAQYAASPDSDLSEARELSPPKAPADPPPQRLLPTDPQGEDRSPHQG